MGLCNLLLYLIKVGSTSAGLFKKKKLWFTYPMSMCHYIQLLWEIISLNKQLRHRRSIRTVDGRGKGSFAYLRWHNITSTVAHSITKTWGLMSPGLPRCHFTEPCVFRIEKRKISFQLRFSFHEKTRGDEYH